MKIKDLPKGASLHLLHVRTTNGREGYWVSQWLKGVWLSVSPDGNGKMNPIFVEDLKECLEWEVLNYNNNV